ncbi:MAG: hypothetical protein R2755_08950 [Acidimicrobiales bacterium]
MSGYTIIDVDTHVSEAPDLWTSRVPASMRDRVPRLEQDARGRDIWVIDGKRTSLAGLLATAGRGDFKEYPSADIPGRLRRQGTAQVHGRDGHLGHGHVPERGRLRQPAVHSSSETPKLMRTCVEAYNDFQTEWASGPQRLLPITSTPGTSPPQ